MTRYLGGKQATWPQVLTGSPSWYPEPFEEYNVSYLPLHLLLDREGRIVDVNPRGKALDEAIERALEAESASQ